MRRARGAGLGLAALVVLSGLMLWLIAPPCLLGCDEVVAGADARARVEAVLPAPLPSDVRVTHLLAGGFQDRFVQIRLSAPYTRLSEVMAAFGADPVMLSPAPNRPFGAASADWWPMAGLPDMRETDGALPGFHAARIGVAPSPTLPATLLVFVFAWQI